MLAYPFYLTFPSSVADKYPELEAVSLSVQPQSDITTSFDFRGGPVLPVPPNSQAEK